MAEEWKLQVSYKTPSGDMINVRANTADELSVLLEGIGDYATQIAAVQKLVVGASNVAPLSTQGSTQSTKPVVSSAPNLNTAPSSTSAGPVCKHGPRKYKSGVSAKTGNPYAFWACPAPQGPDQCKPAN